MFKSDYKNPMTKVFQYECAMLEVMSQMFHRVICKSMCLTKLKLYYSDLAGGSKEKPDYSKQWGMEEMLERMIKRDVLDNINFPGMSLCNVVLRIREREDGSHDFVYTDGVYAFSLHLVTKTEETHTHNVVTKALNIECRNIELSKAA